MLTILGKVIGIFSIVFIGFGANKVGWLPSDISKYLTKIVMNIAAPCVVIHALSVQKMTSDNLETMAYIAGMGFFVYVFSWLFSLLSVKALRVDEGDRGIYKSLLIFSNNAFMGYPVTIALFGSQGMFLMVIVNIWMLIFLYTMGVALMNSVSYKHLTRFQLIKQRIKNIINPPIIATFIGLGIFFLQIDMPIAILDILETVGSMMAPLSMMVIGLLLTQSKPKQVMLNHKLIIISILKLLVMPALTFLVLFPFKLDSLITCIMVLNIMLPSAAMVGPMAEEYGGNAKLAAEGVFLTTLFSMITLPIGGLLLTMYVL